MSKADGPLLAGAVALVAGLVLLLGWALPGSDPEALGPGGSKDQGVRGTDDSEPLVPAEPVAETGLDQILEADRLLLEVPLRRVGGLVEDPDLGFFASREELMGQAAEDCLAFLEPDWVERQVGWVVQGRVQQDPPFGAYRPNRVITESERQEILGAIAGHTTEIGFAATEAKALFEASAEAYVRTITPIAHDAASTLAQAADVDAGPQPRYSCSTNLRAGLWVYPIRFVSTDFPDLEASLERLQGLRRDRQDLLEVLLGPE